MASLLDINTLYAALVIPFIIYILQKGNEKGPIGDLGIKDNKLLKLFTEKQGNQKIDQRKRRDRYVKEFLVVAFFILTISIISEYKPSFYHQQTILLILSILAYLAQVYIFFKISKETKREL